MSGLDAFVARIARRSGGRIPEGRADAGEDHDSLEGGSEVCNRRSDEALAG